MPMVVRSEVWDVNRRLGELGLSKEILIEAVRASAAAHGGCTDNDPPNAKGIEVWRWGVRRLRELLRPAGLEKDDTAGFSTIVDHKRKLRIAVINTDETTGVPGNGIPQNRARKGAASEFAAAVNQLLPGAQNWPLLTAAGRPPVSTYATWHLCVHIDGDVVRAELSLLNGFESGYFTDCRERIILLAPGDWDQLDHVGLGPQDLGPDFDVDVRRK
jgi:hypothetical protein